MKFRLSPKEKAQIMKEKISTSTNGPLVLTNLNQLTEANGNAFKVDKLSIALCRCGESKHKPFCDGTHGKIGWTDEKGDGRQPRRVDSYAGKEITIHDDKRLIGILDDFPAIHLDFPDLLFREWAFL